MWPPDDYRDSNRDPQRGLPEHPEEALAAFALNALDDAEFQAVFHHVVRCLHCQEVLLGFQETAASLTSSAPETPLPPELKSRTLAAALGRRTESPEPEPAPPSAPALPPPAGRWSLRRLRRWMMPAAIGALTLLLAAAVAVIAVQQREITRLAAVNRAMEERPVAPPAAVAASATSTPAQPTIAPASRPAPAPAVSASAPITTAAMAPEAGETDDSRAERAGDSIPIASAAGKVLKRMSDSLTIPRNADAGVAADTAPGDSALAGENADVNLVKQEMADVVEATVLSVQPETEKLPMTSPLGTEPEAKGVLMVDPSGRRAVLMVSGMPADSYQIWLVRGGKQTLVDRIIVNNDDDGAGVKHLELRDSVYDFHEVALLPDERYGPTNPTGAKFLSARIINGPPLPPRIAR